MNIVFICGCMEPGRDGVGDYIRCLSAELLSERHKVSVLALYDPFVSSEIMENQSLYSYNLPVLRLPKTLNKKNRIREAQKWVGDISPDWISLQFVPYSFHDKGLPIGFDNIIKPISEKSKLHIMFHELWLNEVKGIKQQITRFAQQKIITRLVKKLKPEIIHTTIAYNKERLFKYKINAHALELFGNIHKTSNSILPATVPEISDSDITILYFGAPAREIFLDELIKGLKTLNHKGKAVTILVACGKASHKDIFINTLIDELSESIFSIIDCGFLQIDEISTLMSQSTVGIGRAEGHLLGKSGTIIAMLEHGLPVWLPKLEHKEQLIGFEFRTEYIFTDITEACNANLPKNYIDRLKDISIQFITQLEQAK